MQVVERGEKKLPDWLHYDSDNSVLTGSPQVADHGSYTMKLRAECIAPATTSCQDKITRSFHINVVEPLKSEDSLGRQVNIKHVGPERTSTNRKSGNDASNSKSFYYDSSMSFDLTSTLNFVNEGMTSRLNVHDITNGSNDDNTIKTQKAQAFLPETHLHDFTYDLKNVQSEDQEKNIGKETSAVHSNNNFCPNNEISYFTSLLVYIPDVLHFTHSDDKVLRQKLSDFTSKDKRSINTSFTDIGRIVSSDHHILTAGPGNVIESMSESLEVSWHTACGQFEGVNDYTRVLQHNIDVGRITNEIGYGIIAWYMYTDRPVSRRVKRRAHGVVKTATPTFSPPSPSFVVSSSITNFQTSEVSSFSSLVMSSADRQPSSSKTSFSSSSEISLRTSYTPVSIDKSLFLASSMLSPEISDTFSLTPIESKFSGSSVNSNKPSSEELTSEFTFLQTTQPIPTYLTEIPEDTTITSYTVNVSSVQNFTVLLNSTVHTKHRSDSSLSVTPYENQTIFLSYTKLELSSPILDQSVRLSDSFETFSTKYSLSETVLLTNYTKVIATSIKSVITDSINLSSISSLINSDLFSTRTLSYISIVPTKSTSVIQHSSPEFTSYTFTNSLSAATTSKSSKFVSESFSSSLLMSLTDSIIMSTFMISSTKRLPFSLSKDSLQEETASDSKIYFSSSFLMSLSAFSETSVPTIQSTQTFKTSSFETFSHFSIPFSTYSSFSQTLVTSTSETTLLSSELESRNTSSKLLNTLSTKSEQSLLSTSNIISSTQFTPSSLTSLSLPFSSTLFETLLPPSESSYTFFSSTQYSKSLHSSLSSEAISSLPLETSFISLPVISFSSEHTSKTSSLPAVSAYVTSSPLIQLSTTALKTASESVTSLFSSDELLTVLISSDALVHSSDSDGMFTAISTSLIISGTEPFISQSVSISATSLMNVQSGTDLFKSYNSTVSTPVLSANVSESFSLSVVSTTLSTVSTMPFISSAMTDSSVLLTRTTALSFMSASSISVFVPSFLSGMSTSVPMSSVISSVLYSISTPVLESSIFKTTGKLDVKAFILVKHC